MSVRNVEHFMKQRDGSRGVGTQRLTLGDIPSRRQFLLVESRSEDVIAEHHDLGFGIAASGQGVVKSQTQVLLLVAELAGQFGISLKDVRAHLADPVRVTTGSNLGAIHFFNRRRQAQLVQVRRRVRVPVGILRRVRRRLGFHEGAATKEIGNLIGPDAVPISVF